jgi:hypothetical protein
MFRGETEARVLAGLQHAPLFAQKRILCVFFLYLTA